MDGTPSAAAPLAARGDPLADELMEAEEEARGLAGRTPGEAPCRFGGRWKAALAAAAGLSGAAAVGSGLSRPWVRRALPGLRHRLGMKQEISDFEGDIEVSEDERLSEMQKSSLRMQQMDGLVEEDVIYPGNALRFVTEVEQVELCANLCAEDPNCVAWSYAKEQDKPWSNNCYLRGNSPKDSLARVQDSEFTSGMPTHMGRSIDIYDPQQGASLYCFALFIPWSNEKELIEYTYGMNTHIFQCEEYATYSDGQYNVAPGVRTLKVDSDLKCESGGEFGTALNTPIFFAVWDVVIEGGRHRKHDWTVKVDPDCVFFPDRLRGIVSRYQEYQGGTYLNNCNMGLHGPLEVLSQGAVENWASGRDDCVQHFEQQCGGDCQWGEDLFLDQCLQYLRAYRVDDFEQLIEDHCAPPPNWDSCLDDRKTIAAFHPFKTRDAYDACMNNALSPPR